ncbi:MAG: hypothetical protein JRI68_31040 [Deltaproteobacteria bacterium]|nr:hypothetical protein [Deltaproteobacteria bacterium]
MTTTRPGDLVLSNTGDRSVSFRHPGGSSGCAAFQWSILLEHENGTTYTLDYPGHDRMCTAVMVPPSDIVVQPGKTAAQWTLDTDAQWHALDPTAGMPQRGTIKQTSLPAGRYTVTVSGGPVNAQASLVVAR